MSEATKEAEPVTASVINPSLAAQVDKWVGQYVQVRDWIDKLKERHKKELEEYVDIQTKLTGKIQNFLDIHGVDSVKTAQGTAYATIKYSAALADPAIFMDYVIQNGKFDLLDRKANVTAVREYVKENGALPPGVNVSSIAQLGVRRPTKKAA